MSLLYVDSSAWAKLLLEEPESRGLRRFVRTSLRHGDDFCSSELMTTELHRLASRSGVDHADVTAVLQVVTLSLPTAMTFRSAGLLAGECRSLDALHVVAALELGADRFVSYDVRQLGAASAAGLQTLSPGARRLGARG